MPRKAIIETLCPYYFRKCKLKHCDQVPQETDPLKWKLEIDKLASCRHSGVELSKKDYYSHQEEKKEK